MLVRIVKLIPHCLLMLKDAKAQIDGDITFRNPYGYLPGELFGFLPFEGSFHCFAYSTILKLRIVCR